MASRTAQRRGQAIRTTLRDLVGNAPIQEVLACSRSAESPIHGEDHWRAVAAIGLLIAARTSGADQSVAFLFGLLHDAARLTDGPDDDHGPRAADLAKELAREGRLGLSNGPLEKLVDACRNHSRGLVTDDPVIGTCWDADRLTLWRIGVAPDPALLSTEEARRLAFVDNGEAQQTGEVADLLNFTPTWDELLALRGGEVPTPGEPELRAAIAEARTNLGTEAWLASLTPEERWAFTEYTSALGRQVNAVLRSGAHEEGVALKALDDAIAKSVASRPMTLYRGLDPALLEPIRARSLTLLDRGYSSTTLSPTWARMYAALEPRRVVARIDVPAGASAALVAKELWPAPHGGLRLQQEVILPRGSRFLVDDGDDSLRLRLLT